MAKYWMHNGLMQASAEVGKLGGRNTRPGEGDSGSTRAGQDRQVERLGRLQRNAQRVPRPRRSASSCSRPTTDARSTSAKPGSAEVGAGMETFYRFFKRYQRIAGQSFHEISGADREPGRRRNRRRATIRCFSRWSNTETASSKRWTTTSTRAARSAILFDLVRSAEQVRRRREARRRIERGPQPSSPPSNRAPPRFASCRPPWACSVNRSKRPPPATTNWSASSWSLLIEVRAQARKAQRLRHGRHDPQLAGRNRCHAGRPPGGNRVEFD